jgi:hypothetical protein
VYTQVSKSKNDERKGEKREEEEGWLEEWPPVSLEEGSAPIPAIGIRSSSRWSRVRHCGAPTVC